MQLIEKLISHIGDRPVVLGGGSMQNRILLTHLMAGIEKMGLNAYTGETVPVNDGGLSLGQLFIAAHSTTQGNP
jgi:hydrogenase maturation protein HypF